jgi:hypothetical protein
VNTEFTESANQDILSGRKGSFDNFKESFDQIDGLIERISVFLGQRLDKIVFGEGHWRESFLGGTGAA